MHSAGTKMTSQFCVQRTASLPCGMRRRTLHVKCAVKKSSAKQVVCSKTLHASDSHFSQVDQLCRDVAEFSRKRMADKSTGIVQFDCFPDNYEPHVIHFYERYISNASLGQHNTTPQMKKFMEEVQPLLSKPVGMILYTYNNGQLGCMALQGGPKGEGGLDDATGASGAAGGAGLKQTSATVDLTKVKEAEDDFIQEAMGDLKKSVKDLSSGFRNIFDKMLAGTGKK